ncbi:nitroreductase family deazaflavin-dependent oxidoreductase [Nocardia gamkensis]|uniref:Nitroreductase family deazaflavin-dependent oxidoreductase n=1 Tax=Nocardia gamkensis TaxID=352869 RepID=A0A7X6R278_9NOCA|nr:nitroreductase family deazaflavin-dependent oxidoreductase [Nocardia gamkensis]NKY26124.1 nitroreductase family deazaflavin-dependent oxidoreductase [Nocardia gamkensis]NQE69365.1 Deazaflavin-dependent nitroreductase [Nocardia gamkensis]
MVSNPVPALARRLAQRRWVMRSAPVVLRVERLIRRASGGRKGVLDLAGLPSVEVTVPGRKTGIPRTTSLLYVPHGADFVVLGSNWGGPKHPAWSANLRAAQTASVRHKGEQFPATVREITGVERKRVWDLAVEFWPGYAMEYELSGGRVFRIFELRRVSD